MVVVNGGQGVQVDGGQGVQLPPPKTKKDD